MVVGDDDIHVAIEDASLCSSESSDTSKIWKLAFAGGQPDLPLAINVDELLDVTELEVLSSSYLLDADGISGHLFITPGGAMPDCLATDDSVDLVPS